MGPKGQKPQGMKTERPFLYFHPPVQCNEEVKSTGTSCLWIGVDCASDLG